MLKYFKFDSAGKNHGGRPTKFLWALVFLYGMSVFDLVLESMINFLSEPLKKFYNESIFDHYGVYLDDKRYNKVEKGHEKIGKNS